MSGADTTIMDSLDSFLSGPPSLQYNAGSTPLVLVALCVKQILQSWIV